MAPMPENTTTDEPDASATQTRSADVLRADAADELRAAAEAVENGDDDTAEEAIFSAGALLNDAAQAEEGR